MSCIKNFFKNWKFLTLVGVLVALLVIPATPGKIFLGNDCKTKQVVQPHHSGVLYTGLVMMVLFVIRYPHMGVVSFLPIAFLPLFSLQKTSPTASMYMRNANMTFFATVLVGISLGLTRIQVRFVYFLMALSGMNLITLVIIVMWTTAILSAFLTSSTAMFIMMPVALLIRDEIIKCLLEDEPEESTETIHQKIFFKRRFTTVPKNKSKTFVPPVDMIPSNQEEEELPSTSTVATADESNINSAQDMPKQETDNPNPVDNPEVNVETDKNPEEMDGSKGQVDVVVEKTPVVVEKPPEIDIIDKLHPDDKSSLLKFEESLLLSIAAAANIGGIFFPYSTMVSDYLYYMTPKIYAAQKLPLDSAFKPLTTDPKGKYYEYHPYIAYGVQKLTLRDWVVYNFPTFIIIMLVVSYLQVFMSFANKSNSIFNWKNNSVDDEGTGGVIKTNDPQLHKKVKEIMKRRYHELGWFRFREYVLITLFTAYAFLFFFREPRYIIGWMKELQYFHNPDPKSKIPHFKIGDSCMAMTLVAIFYYLPRSIKEMVKPPTEDKNFVVDALIPFKLILKKMPWGVLLMIGASNAMAEITEVTYFNEQVAEYTVAFISHILKLPKEILLLILLVVTSICSQLFGNVMVIGVSIPLLLKVSCGLQVHPWYFVLPVTTSCILSFMFPVSSVPNAILFHQNNISFSRMIRQGWLVNIVTVFIVYMLHVTYAELIFDFSSWKGHIDPRVGTCFMTHGCEKKNSLIS